MNKNSTFKQKRKLIQIFLVTEEFDDFKKQFPRRSLRLSQKTIQPKKKDENGGEPNLSDNLRKESVVDKSAGKC